MSAAPFASEVRALLRYLGKHLEIPAAKPMSWPLVRAVAVAGFVVFAAVTCYRWLGTAVRRPLHSESIELRDLHAASLIEQDIALLRRWLPVEGKIGFWSELPQFRSGNVRLHLAPLLLDPDWGKHDLVLVDYVAAAHRPALAAAGYQLVAELTTARAFAGGMTIYRRNPR